MSVYKKCWICKRTIKEVKELIKNIYEPKSDSYFMFDILPTVLDGKISVCCVCHSLIQSISEKWICDILDIKEIENIITKETIKEITVSWG